MRTCSAGLQYSATDRHREQLTVVPNVGAR